MTSARLTLTIGIPACGKSTWSREQFEADPDTTVIVERDKIRETLYGSRSMDGTNEGLVTRLAQQLARQGLDDGKHVIISDTNTVPKYRKQWVRLAHEFDVTAEYKTFDTPFEVCLERNAARPQEMRVPEDVMMMMYDRLQNQ